MGTKREELVPSKDLADFYAIKISTCLTAIYNYWHELTESRIQILKINLEIDDIFKQIKNRLMDHNLKESIDKYIDLNKSLAQLVPFKYQYEKDSEGERIRKLKINKDYLLYKKITIEKECLIWECLDNLGLLGKVDIKTRRLG